MPLSFSTAWNSHRHTDGAAMLREIADLGFEYAELSHGIRVSLLEGVEKALKQGVIKLSSFHNFCPLPPEITVASPNCYEFTSHRPSERERAYRLTCQTIDFAVRFGVDRVVMHLGRVPLPGATDRLINLVTAGQINTRNYVRQKIAFLKRRERLGRFYFNRMRAFFTRVVEYAEKKGVKLGIESREVFEEIPTERELTRMLEEFGAENAGYWHDFGHVQIKHNLGLLDHEEWLASVAHRLIGCHVHDTHWPARDHRAPFSGRVAFTRLVPLLPPGIPRVFELSPKVKKDEILEAREKWLKLDRGL
jgi:sugar phosphate isomerase/epimerase